MREPLRRSSEDPPKTPRRPSGVSPYLYPSPERGRASSSTAERTATFGLAVSPARSLDLLRHVTDQHREVEMREAGLGG
jgi:hypothetical protein